MSCARSIRGALLPIATTVALVFADPAHAVWGERWGEMVWGDAGYSLQVPTLTDEGVLMVVLSVLLIGAFITRRRHVGRRAPR